MDTHSLYESETGENVFLNTIEYSPEYVQWLESRVDVLLNPPKSDNAEDSNPTHNSEIPKLPTLEECEDFVKVNLTDGILKVNEDIIVTEMYIFIAGKIGI